MIQKILAQLGGIANLQQIRGRGLNRRHVAMAIREGFVIRIRRGWYGLPGMTIDQYSAVRVGGILGGLAAARSYGLWGGIAATTDVLLAKNASRLRTHIRPSARAGHEELSVDKTRHPVRLRWVGINPEVLSPDTETSWRVDPITAVLQVLAWADAETAIACVESAYKLLHLDAEQIWEHRERSGLSDSELYRAKVLLDSTMHGADSGLESVMRQRVEALGLKPLPQKHFDGVGRVDFYFKEHNVVIETDGAAFHSDEAAQANDQRRDRLLSERGVRVYRFTYQQVIHEWSWVREKLSTIFFNNQTPKMVFE